MALRRPPTTFSDEISAADLAANSVGASELADNAVDANAIAANAVTTAKILNANITTDKIANDAVDADKLASNAVVSASIVDANITKEKMAASAIEVKPHIIPGVLYPAMKDTGGTVRQVDGVTAVVASTTGPAGSTVASSLYGTVQSDGRMYYYTDIKGSKPIKDPRIGTHFGSQRHKFKSIQKLEQESAAHGTNVYSVDGREWIRGEGNAQQIENDNTGVKLRLYGNDNRIEIVGYFNDANLLFATLGATVSFNVYINGGTVQLNNTAVVASAQPYSTPSGRFIDPSTCFNLSFNSTPTLGINTLRISTTGGDQVYCSGCELIAHDKFTDATCDTTSGDATVTHNANGRMAVGMSVTGTGIPAGSSIASVTSTTAFELSQNASATNSNQTLTFGAADLSIPPQNVVSYGKKFALSPQSLHYNPFAYKTDGATAWTSPVSGNNNHNGTAWPVGTGSSHNIDTATSLGLDKWLHSSNYYKPYNGGRVVIWVDSSGNIKTSVTVMPPNARSIKTTAITAKANASVANDTFLPTYEAGIATAYESSALSEVAKEFYVCEFGNGAANEATNTSGNWQDFSMLNAQDDVMYTMDDGLTMMTGDDVANTRNYGGIRTDAVGDAWTITFIGTGITLGHDRSTNYASTDAYVVSIDGVDIKTYSAGTSKSGEELIVQNLPYGTHILKMRVTGNPASEHMEMDKTTFFQPKMPPIPEDATILADYMLMAEFVVKTGAADAGAGKISKGVRFLSSTRDILYDGTGQAITQGVADVGALGFYQYASNTSAAVSKVPSFSTQATKWTYDATNRRQAFKVNGSTLSTTHSAGGHASYYHPTAVSALGNNIWSTEGSQIGSSPSGSTQTQGFEFAIPIHTSSHYQTFETPLLHELVGGDRNMEQNNLIVTADGKSWDEVTRDTSYISNTARCMMNTDSDFAWSSVIKPDEWRGSENVRNYFNKDFAIAKDRLICLVNGYYNIYSTQYTRPNVSSVHHAVKINDLWTHISYTSTITNNRQLDMSINVYLKRGDYLSYHGEWGSDGDDYHHMGIDRIN